ncbi:MAG: sodium-translocating pyrophosphatase [Planctomycetota bacterium]
MIPYVWWIAPVGSILALLFAFIFFKSLMAQPGGDEKMVEIATAVKDGAMAYLSRQYKVVFVFFIVTSLILAVMAFGFGLQSGFVPFAFFTGGFFSGLAGFFGMYTATRASNRTTQGAKQSLNQGLQVAFRSGAVMGLTVVGLGLLDICMWFLILYWAVPALGFEPLSLMEITVTMLCFGMGASSQALFARVGGGIFTKAADVGADLVGKVEAGIPEDDPRNPATIADNVGDNVGDVAGMGADLYESYCGSILATAALGVAAAAIMARPGALLGLRVPSLEGQINLLIAPMVLAGIGVILSIVGIYVVRTREQATQSELLKALFRGINLSSFLVLVSGAGVAYFLLEPVVGFWPAAGLFGAITAGLSAGVAIGYSTTYYTSDAYEPTRNIARQASTGPATVIISGIAEGMMSTGYPVLIIVTGMLLAFTLPGGWKEPALGLYGVGIAAVGMLSTLGITLATDAYGPIADNAGGNAEMSGQEPIVRERTDALDSLGNTTAATGKGFAIGSAALTALALLAAYVEEVRIGIDRTAEWAYSESSANKDAYVLDGVGNEIPMKGFHDVGHGLFAHSTKNAKGENVVHGYFLDHTKSGTGELKGATVPVLRSTENARLSDFMTFYKVNLMNPRVLIGMFLGAMMAFVFCALTMKAVGRAAASMVQEVRRQFRTIAGIMEGTGKPDYARCVDISTKGAQREMIVPSLLALSTPVAVGMVLGVAGVMGLLVGGLSTGFVLAIMMANAGGAWDNAKKFIESGGLKERLFAPKELVEKARSAKDAVIEDGMLVITDSGQEDPILGTLSQEEDSRHAGGSVPIAVIRAKGSDHHKAGVVSDTVGDPFKDTSGPSLNILIKLMSMVSVVFAGLTVKFGPIISSLLGMS